MKQVRPALIPIVAAASLAGATCGLAGIALAQTPRTPEGTPMVAASPPSGATPAAARLRPLLPATLAGWSRRSLALPEPTLGPAIAPSARAEYRRAKQVAEVDVSDLTAAPPPPWTGAPLERDTEAGREVVRRDGDRTVREETGRPGQKNSVSLTLRNGIVVGASGLGVPIADLRRLAEAIDLNAAEGLPKR